MKRILLTLCCILGLFPLSNRIIAQETTEQPAEKTVEPIKNTFENSIFNNGQTTQVNAKNELGSLIQHRFGQIKSGSDLYGIYAPANIRLGINYGITKDFTVGLGITKSGMQTDIEWKYRILQQSKGGGSPITLTYYGDFARSDAASGLFKNQKGDVVETNRYTFYHELMASYKYNSKISVQAGFYLVHRNIVDSIIVTHDRIGLNLLGRYKFSPQSSILLSYSNQLVALDNNYKPFSNSNDKLKGDLVIGYEVSTGSHQFQIFIANAAGILNQDIRSLNLNDMGKREFLFGFNITRQWGF